MLYLNTNLGAVAALSAETGQPTWIVRYPRAKKGDLNQRATHFYRDLTPCLYDRGRLIVATADSESVLPTTPRRVCCIGKRPWPRMSCTCSASAVTALWSSGEKLWRINVATGKVNYPGPRGRRPRALVARARRWQGLLAHGSSDSCF